MYECVTLYNSLLMLFMCAVALTDLDGAVSGL